MRLDHLLSKETNPSESIGEAVLNRRHPRSINHLSRLFRSEHGKEARPLAPEAYLMYDEDDS